MNDAQQALRATNQDLRRLISDSGSEETLFVCECGANDCDQMIRMTAEEFDAFVGIANGMPLISRKHR